MNSAKSILDQGHEPLDSRHPHAQLRRADNHGERFRALYQEARAVTTDPTEILERLYVAVAGPNFRMDGKRANAAFSVVSYFFDSCHIFEMPSSDAYIVERASNVASD